MCKAAHNKLLPLNIDSREKERKIKISKIKKRTKNLDVVKSMPDLYHTLPGEGFDINKSEVVNWLIRQEGVKQFLFNTIRNYHDTEVPFIYNPETGKWQGVDFEK